MQDTLRFAGRAGAERQLGQVVTAGAQRVERRLRLLLGRPAGHDLGEQLKTSSRVVGGVENPESRAARRRKRRIEEILIATAELVGERGYDAVGLDDVAERLDLTKGSLYHYFASKEALVSAAIETFGRDLTARLERTVADLHGTPGQRLRGLLAEQAAMIVRDHPDAIKPFMLPRSWPEPQRSRLKELRRQHDELFRSILLDGVRAGEFAVLDVDITLQCMHAAINQAHLWARRMTRRELDTALHTLIDTLMLLVGEKPESPEPA